MERRGGAIYVDCMFEYLYESILSPSHLGSYIRPSIYKDTPQTRSRRFRH